MKKITFKDQVNKNYNFWWGFIIASILCYLGMLLITMYQTPVVTFNGYIMKFNGEKIKVVQDVKAQEPPPLTMEDYVNQKFGKDAWRAFAILHGTKYCGGENGKYNPLADNVNTHADGTKSTDKGYWQFNNRFHPEVSEECARDVKCSTDRAYEIFKHDKGFKQWTAGKCIGL